MIKVNFFKDGNETYTLPNVNSNFIKKIAVFQNLL